MISTITTGVPYFATDYMEGRKLVRTKNGELHCVYRGWDEQKKTQIFYAVSKDNGQMWQIWPLTVGIYRQWYPTIAVDDADNLHIAWTGSDGSTYNQLYYTRMSGGVMQTIERITDWDGDCYYAPSIAIDGDNNPHIVFWAGETKREHIWHACNFGDVWEFEDLTPNEIGTNQEPTIEIDLDNNIIHVAWNQASKIMYRRCVEGKWQEPIVICHNGGTQQMQSLAFGGTSVRIAWFGVDPAAYHYNAQIFSGTSQNYGANWEEISLEPLQFGYHQNPNLTYGNKDNYVIWNDGDKKIRYNVDGRSYTIPSEEACYYPCAIWSPRNQPKFGFACIYTEGRTDAGCKLQYFASDDLAWDVEPTPEPEIKTITCPNCGASYDMREEK